MYVNIHNIFIESEKSMIPIIQYQVDSSIIFKSHMQEVWWKKMLNLKIIFIRFTFNCM